MKSLEMKKHINKLHRFITVILSLFLLSMPATKISAEDIQPLILGVHPYLPPAEIKKRFTPLLHYISRELGIPIELSISKDYETHIENIGNKSFDIAYIGPSSYRAC